MRVYVGGYIISKVASKTDINTVLNKISMIRGIVFSHRLFGPDSIISHYAIDTVESLRNEILNSFSYLVKEGCLLSYTPNIVMMDNTLSVSICNNKKVSAWLLINTLSNLEEKLVLKLRKIGCVNNVHVVTGEYSVFIYVGCESMSELIELIDITIPSLLKVKKIDTRLVSHTSEEDRFYDSKILGLFNSSLRIESF